jgi:hypothetical protein
MALTLPLYPKNVIYGDGVKAMNRFDIECKMIDFNNPLLSNRG